jgi:intermediate peptidase
MDFVETPSHWMEHFVWDPDFLGILCQRHDQVMDHDSIQALAASRNQFRCLEMQSQIILSRFDQEIFGGPSIPGRPQKIWTQLHNEYQVPFVPETHFYTNVGHFVTYGAGYYGYLYSQVFAGAIWNELFTPKGSMDRTAGQRLWKGMLIHGGARDAKLMLFDLLGGKTPTIESFGHSLSMMRRS